jgi:hypothetical protein
LPGHLRAINHNRAKLAQLAARISEEPSSATAGDADPDLALLIRVTQEARTMRINGPNGTTLGSAAGNVRRSSSTGFALPEDAASTQESRAVISPKTAANIDALLAMQGIEDPVERRKRSVQRGKGALDVLDDLKIGLLSGNFNTATVSRLREAAANLKSSSGDPGLDAILSEIELRVEVELAKAGQS